jgi:hypothetical protein
VAHPCVCQTEYDRRCGSQPRGACYLVLAK